MRKRKLETLRLIQQVQEAAIKYIQQTSSESRTEIYEAAIMKPFQIGYSTFLNYMKEANVSGQIAEYEQKRQKNV